MSHVICESLYPYEGTEGQPTPLLFGPGEEILVIKKEATGWWEGEKNGQRGWFPASYVKERTPLPSPPPELKEPPLTPEPLPPGWREAKTPEGKTYYYFKKTKETTWVRPTSNNVGDRKISVKNANGSKTTSPASEKQHLRSISSGSSPGNSPPGSPGPMKKGSDDNKPLCYVVNGVCLPDAKRAKEQELLQPGRFSYCDYFWRDKGDKHVYESGFSVLLTKIQKGKHLCKEMSELFKAREALELQYSKGLAALASEVLGATEEGTLGEAWKQVKTSLSQESKIHRDFAAKLRTEIEKPLFDHKDEGKKELKKVEASMSDLRKQMTHKHQAVEREKITMNERQRELETKLQSPKRDEDVIKAKRKSTKQREDLNSSISTYNDVKDRWFEETVTQSLALENREVERVDLVRKQFQKYAKLMQDVSSKTTKASETLKQKTEAIDPAKDREAWVKQNKTGTVRPIDMVPR